MRRCKLKKNHKSLVKTETITGTITVRITRYKGTDSQGLPGERGETRYGKIWNTIHFFWVTQDTLCQAKWGGSV